MVLWLYIFFPALYVKDKEIPVGEIQDTRHLLGNNTGEQLGVEELRPASRRQDWRVHGRKCRPVPFCTSLKIPFIQWHSLHHHPPLSPTKRQSDSGAKAARTCARLGLALHGAHGRGGRWGRCGRAGALLPLNAVRHRRPSRHSGWKVITALGLKAGKSK